MKYKLGKKGKKSKKSRRSKRSRKQRGGRVIMPIEYHGYDSGRYFKTGSSELYSPKCQRPASFGTIFNDGTAGPILRTQYGGNSAKKSNNSFQNKLTKSSNKLNNLNTTAKNIQNKIKRL